MTTIGGMVERGLPIHSLQSGICVLSVYLCAFMKQQSDERPMALSCRPTERWNSSAITRRSSFGRLSIGMAGLIALVGMGWGCREFIIISPSLVVLSLLGALGLFFFWGDWYCVV
ncbi:hypothetical protein HOY82DRAFT_177784 [Tuber indicum]|nr:hypothetical protein HOY82DRAFT_177784 [Tuber indicum]